VTQCSISRDLSLQQHCCENNICDSSHVIVIILIYSLECSEKRDMSEDREREGVFLCFALNPLY